MTTADVVEACIDSLQGDVVNEYLQQYADILRQTTEGTDALVSDLSEEANIVHCYEEMTNLCRAYEQRIKVVEAETIERCAKVCEVMGAKHFECPEMSEYCADAIRTLAKPTLAAEGMVSVPVEPTEAMISYMAGSRAVDDEGEFPMLLDLIGYSGENKTRTVLRAAYKAMLEAAKERK